MILLEIRRPLFRIRKREAAACLQLFPHKMLWHDGANKSRKRLCQREGSNMDERTSLSRRKLLHTLAGTGVIAAADLAWWDAPLYRPAQGLGRRAGALPMERSRADAHRADEFAGRALQSVAEGFRGADRIRAAGAGASEADQRRSPAETRPISARSGTTGSASSTAWAPSKTSPRAQRPGSIMRTSRRRRGKP